MPFSEFVTCQFLVSCLIVNCCRTIFNEILNICKLFLIMFCWMLNFYGCWYAFAKMFFMVWFTLFFPYYGNWFSSLDFQSLLCLGNEYYSLQINLFLGVFLCIKKHCFSFVCFLFDGGNCLIVSMNEDCWSLDKSCCYLFILSIT